MAPRAQAPVLLLTGFLGSGKTSLLARWLQAPECAGAVVIVNELGEVGLDDRLVRTATDSAILLENGCVCCAAGDDLAGALERLFWDRLERRIPAFDRVLIETTGVAEPLAVCEALAKNDVAAERYRLAGIVTTFEARRGPELAALHPECEAQARAADVLILTKPDLADADEIIAAQAVLRTLNPHAPVLQSLRGDLPAARVFAALQERAGAPATHACGRDHAHDDTCAAGAHTHEHLHGVSSSFLPFTRAADPQALEAALQDAWARFGADLLRVKGAARLGGGAEIEIVQSAPGEPLERTPHAVPADARPPRCGLTIIARETPADEIASFVAARLAIAAIGAATQSTGAHP